MGYFVIMQIGNDANDVLLQLDIDSEWIWTNTISESFESTTETYSVLYDLGRVRGTFGSDSVQLDYFSKVSNVNMLQVLKANRGFKEWTANGILGLGLKPVSSGKSFMETLVE